MRRIGAARFVLLAFVSTACGARQVVPLLTSAGIPITHTPSGSIPMEVVTRSTSVRDPLPVSGTTLAYADFEAALGHAVSTATVPWAATHVGRRPGGWQLFVEVIQAEADHDGSRMLVTIGVRATLRARVGGTHIGQTERACRDGGLVPAERAASVLYACMMRIGRDLTAWLSAVEPDLPTGAEARAVPTTPNPFGAIGASGSGARDDDDDDDGDSQNTDGDGDGDGAD
jgi:hypothetical protein